MPRKVNMFDGHPKGICSVAFMKPEEADRAISNLDGKLFRGRQISGKHCTVKYVYPYSEF